MGAKASILQREKEAVEALRREIKELESSIREVNEKSSGAYWHRIDTLWNFEPVEYIGCFEQGLALRKNKTMALYQDLHHFITNGQGIQATLDASVFDPSNSETSRTVVTTSDTDEVAQQEKRKRQEDARHDRNHLKNFLGEESDKNYKSRAHLFPKDQECFMWWWPMYRIVTGHQDSEINYEALKMIATMKTNKLDFPGAHNCIYDNLTQGCVCAIPIYDSMEALADWDYQKPFKMLIVCDSADTYRALRMVNEKSYADAHVRIASREEVDKASRVVQEMMRILADSLNVHLEDHYQGLDDRAPGARDRKKMLETMRKILMEKDNQVDVPVCKLGDEEAPRLYTIDYAMLYKNDKEGAKYIPDPLSLLIKAAVNLSAVVYKTEKCKLLPVCSFSDDDDESSGTVDVIDLMEAAVLKKGSATGLLGREIDVRVVVTDDEDDGGSIGEHGNEGDWKGTDSASVSSEDTFDEG